MLYTHLYKPRVCQIVASTRKRNHNLTWQLRAKILIAKGTMVLSNTMVTEEGTEAQQRAVATAHLEDMCRDAAAIKKRKKRAPLAQQPQAKAPNLRQRTPPSSNAEKTDDGHSFSAEKRDGHLFSAEKRDDRANNKRPSSVSYARRSLDLLKTLQTLKTEASADKDAIHKMQHHITTMQTLLEPNRQVKKFQQKAYKPVAPLFEEGHRNLKHYQKNIKQFHNELIKITGSNATIDQELIKGLGLKHNIQMFDPKDAEQAVHQDAAIVDSLVRYYNMLRVDNNND